MPDFCWNFRIPEQTGAHIKNIVPRHKFLRTSKLRCSTMGVCSTTEQRSLFALRVNISTYHPNWASASPTWRNNAFILGSPCTEIRAICFWLVWFIVWLIQKSKSWEQSVTTVLQVYQYLHVFLILTYSLRVSLHLREILPLINTFDLGVLRLRALFSITLSISPQYEIPSCILLIRVFLCVI